MDGKTKELVLQKIERQEKAAQKRCDERAGSSKRIERDVAIDDDAEDRGNRQREASGQRPRRTFNGARRSQVFHEPLG